MGYIRFRFLFTLIHTGAYFIAGLLAYRISRDHHKGENRLLDFMKEMSERAEPARVARLTLPLQLVRGLVLSIVLYTPSSDRSESCGSFRDFFSWPA